MGEALRVAGEILERLLELDGFFAIHLRQRHGLHGVLAEFLLVQRVDGVLSRDYLVGVDVVAELPGATPDHLGKCHLISAGIFARTSEGCVITPATALAAATAGLER